MSLQKPSQNLSNHPTNHSELTQAEVNSSGRLLALDLGAKRVGVAISDELRITVTPLQRLERHSWKDLLRQVATLVESYDARALIIGLPLNMDGTRGDAAEDALRIAENFRKSLNVPILLQDERLTSVAAESEMKSRGLATDEVMRKVDSESAAIILRDFLTAHIRED